VVSVVRSRGELGMMPYDYIVTCQQLLSIAARYRVRTQLKTVWEHSPTPNSPTQPSAQQPLTPCCRCSRLAGGQEEANRRGCG
jgi:hypothetical protein